MLNQIIEIHIVKNIFEGKGMGYYKNHTVMVDKAIKGQTVKTKIYQKKQNLLFGSIVEIVNHSEIQITPKCIHFTECGGCSYQYIDYQKQIEMKLEILNEQLKNHTIIDKIIPSNTKWTYRNKAEFSYKYNKDDGYISLGFHKKNEFDNIIDLKECHIVNPISIITLNQARNKANEILSQEDKKQLKHLLIRSSKYENLICLTVEKITSNLISYIKSISDSYNVIAIKDNSQTIYLTDKTNIIEQIGKYKFAIGINSFLQTNTDTCVSMYNAIYEMTDPQTTLLELYGGVATIGIYLSDKFKKIISSDILEENIKLANINKDLNNISNLHIIHCSAEEFINHLQQHKEKINTLIIDPNRAGLNKKVIRNISKINPQSIIYISCNPSTLSRDINLLYVLGYDIIKTVAIDMFPQTYHIETIIKLQKNSDVYF